MLFAVGGWIRLIFAPGSAAWRSLSWLGLNDEPSGCAGTLTAPSPGVPAVSNSGPVTNDAGGTTPARRVRTTPSVAIFRRAPNIRRRWLKVVMIPRPFVRLYPRTVAISDVKLPTQHTLPQLSEPFSNK